MLSKNHSEHINQSPESFPLSPQNHLRERPSLEASTGQYQFLPVMKTMSYPWAEEAEKDSSGDSIKTEGAMVPVSEHCSKVREPRCITIAGRYQ